MRVHAGAEEFVIGLLCLLYREGRIQFSIRFPLDGSIEIQREEIERNKKDIKKYTKIFGRCYIFL